MSKYLLIAEISQKQAYIFGSRKLRDNLERSENIRNATSPQFFSACCGEDFDVEENLVYSGGGHTVLQFTDREQARRVAQSVGREVLRRWPGMEMFAKLEEYRPDKTPGENLTALGAALEKKKALRLASFYRYNFGIDVARAAPPREGAEESSDSGAARKRFLNWTLTADGNELAGDDNFLAVVHIDGNAMGARVQHIYQEAGDDWERCKALLRQFSEEIDAHYNEAYTEMCTELAEVLPSLGRNAAKDPFPVRRVIGAGDDVCFVCAGKLGISCAASFIRHLSQKRNGADGRSYAACAGICMIHKKYPFRAAYDLSEQLCANAKQFGASYDENGSVCAVDWHIEFGQLKDSLGKIRSDYRTDDGGRLELRPYALFGEMVPPQRAFAFFCTLLRQLANETKRLPRSKIKPLRDAFREGEVETRLALRRAEMEHLPQLGLEMRTPDWQQRILREGGIEREAFIDDGVERRCLYFDAIELIDHIVLWEDRL